MRFLIVSGCFLALAGCAVIMLPTHRGQTVSLKIQDAVSVTPVDNNVTVPSPIPANPAVDSASAGASNPSIAHALIKAPDGKTTCGPYMPPAHANPPGTPNFSDEERRDPNKLNVRLVEYVGELRDYILKIFQSDNDAYTQYQKSCAADQSIDKDKEKP